MKPFNIFGLIVPIKISKDVPNNLAGFYDFVNKSITISSDLPTKYDKQHTELHEFLHAYFHRTSFAQTGIPHEVQELLCDQIPTALLENYKLTRK